MLNKGPFIVQAVKLLDDVLLRMQVQQEKKTPRLRIGPNRYQCGAHR
jgi:pyruvate kinase